MIDFSSVILDSYLLNKPVISLNVKNNEFGTPFAFKNNSCICTNVDELEKIIHLLDDQKFYNEMVENRKKSASKYLITAANSSKKLYNLLSNFDFNKT